MVKVHYQHPPRKWDFYAGYLLWLLFTCLPIGIFTLLWLGNLPSVHYSVAVAICIGFWLWYSWKRILERFVLYYDYMIDKSQDVSHLRLIPEKKLRPAISSAKHLGFQRLGESQSFVGFDASPKEVRQMITPSQDIVCELLLVDYIQPFCARFCTWFDNTGLVETYYPIGEAVHTENCWRDGINTSLEAAFHYHLRQVAEFEKLHGGPILVTSIADITRLQNSHNRVHDPGTHPYFKFRYLLANFLINLSLSALIFLVAAIIAFVDGNLNSATMVPSTLILFALGFLYLPINQSKGRSIQQAKKKAG